MRKIALLMLAMIAAPAMATIALRNIAAVMATGDGVPELPTQVWGLTATGDTNQLYQVTWTNNTAGRFSAAGVVMVGGTSVVDNVVMPVVASVRVAPSQPVGEVNHSGDATGTIVGTVNKGYAAKISDTSEPIQNIWDSDVLLEAGYGVEVKVKQEWSSEQTISKVKMCYLHNTGNGWCMDPDNVVFYSDAACTQQIATDGGTLVLAEASNSNGEFHWYEYVFSEPQSLTTLVGSFRHSIKETVIIRCWAYSGGVGVVPSSSAVLNVLTVEGGTLADFVPATCDYTVPNATGIAIASATANTGITILPLNSDTTNAYVVTVSEDGSHGAKYSVYMPKDEEPESPSGNVFMLRNIAAVTTENVVPDLPTQVWGLTSEGETNELVTVAWSDNTASRFTEAASPVTVHGSATVGNVVKNVTASVRVEQGGGSGAGEETHHVTDATITATVEGGCNNNTASTGIYFDSIDNFNTTDVWSGENVVNLTGGTLHADYVWPSPGVKIDKVVTYVYNKYNNAIDGLSFYANGSSTPIAFSEVAKETVGNFFKNEYRFATPVTATSLRLNVYGPNQTLIYRVWPIEVAGGAGGGAVPSDSALLNTMTTAGGTLVGFSPTTYNYTVSNATGIATATATVNTGITILPLCEDTTNAYVVTVAEDGEHAGKYSVYMPKEEEPDPPEPPMVDDTFALRNIAIAMATSDDAAVLPGMVWGLNEDGTTNRLYSVAWTNNTAGRFSAAGIVMVGGTSVVNGVVMPVSASVRVELASQGGGEPTNLSADATINQVLDISNANYHHDDVIKHTTIPSGWVDSEILARTGAGNQEFRIKVGWDGQKTLSSVQFYVYKNGAYWDLPDAKLEFYSDEDCQHQIEYYSVDLAAAAAHPVNQQCYFECTFKTPVVTDVIVAKLKSELNQMMVTRFWVIGTNGGSGGGNVTPRTNVNLDDLKVDGTTVTGFAANTYAYTVTNGNEITAAAASENTGITILPLCEDTTNAYVVTVAEDGITTGLYSVFMPEGCRHPETNTLDAVAATCTTHGLTEGKQCNICQKILVSQEETPLAPHAEVVTDTLEATCAEGGHTGGTHCSVCGHVITEPTPTSALGHLKKVDVEYLAPTEEVPGHTEGAHCLRCNEILSVSTEIPKLLPIAALRNISTVTSEGVVPSLTNIVMGLTANGELRNEYLVTWPLLTAEQFSTPGLVTITGSAQVGTTNLDVTASVRVVDSTPLPTNFVYNIPPSCPAKSGGMAALVDGNITKNAWGTWARYNGDNGYVYSNENFTITFPLNTPRSIQAVKIYYNLDASYTYAPYLSISVSSDGNNWTPMTFSPEETAAVHMWTYAFTTVQEGVTHVKIDIGVNPGGERSIEVEASAYKYLKLSEIEIVGDGDPESATPNSLPALSELMINGTNLTGFASTMHDALYKYFGVSAETNFVAMSTNVNAGITVLPIWTNDIMHVVSLAEDGRTQWVWQVLFCKHEHSTRYGGHDPGCENLGDTGSLVCDRCGYLIEATQARPVLGHDWGEWATTIEAGAATRGERSHVCNRCGKEEREPTPALEGMVSALLSGYVEDGTGDNWKVTGIIQNYSVSGYYPPEEFGFVLYDKEALGAGRLTVNTPGRTKITFDVRNVVITEHDGKICGDYTYLLRKFQAVGTFRIRPWMRYIDNEGISRYTYGDPFDIGK